MIPFDTLTTMSGSPFWEHLGRGDETDRNRRQRGRIRQESVASSFGPVLDLSAGGARILSTGAPRGHLEITLNDGQHQLTLTAEVMWTCRRGLFKREIGVKFIGVTPEEARLLAKMTMQNSVARTLHDRAA